jgi:hypothetical protein
MADTKKNNLGAIQGNLTAAYNARIKRNDLFNKGYAVSPDKAKDILLQESINQNVDKNKGELSNAPAENMQPQMTKEPDVPRARPYGRLYRVMYAGKTADKDEVYKTQKDADEALKRAGGKGAVATVNLSQKTRGVEFSDEETEARNQRYIAQLEKRKSDKMAYDENLKRIKSPEYKAEVKERLRLANEAKLEKDRAEGAKFAKWSSDVSARRQAGAQLDFYKKQLGVLRRASSQARQAKDPITELAINQAIGAYTAGVPQESGAMQRAAEEGMIAERNKMFADQMRAAQEEEARRNRTAAANSDYNQYNRGNGLIARKPLGF